MSPHQWNPWHGVPRDVLDEGQEDGRTKHDGTQDAAGRPQDPDDPNDPYLEGLPVSTNRYLAQAARIEALEEWVRDSARFHCEAGVVLPDAHGEPHRDLCERARTLLSTTKEPDRGK